MNKVIKKTPKNKAGIRFSILHKILPFFVIIVSMHMASNNLAYDLRYNCLILGKPLFFLKEEAIYPFYAILRAYVVSLRWGNVIVSNIIFDNAKIIVLGAFIAVVIYFFLVFIRRLANNKDSDLYSTNRWGTKKDLENAGLLQDRGVVLGQGVNAKVKGSMKNGSCYLDVKKTSYLIQYNNNVSSLVIAGSRLGKGVSTVVPTHLSYPGSIISIDPKGENYAITAGYRSRFSHIIKFNPVSDTTVHFNIMDEIEEKFAFRDANTIANIITSTDSLNSTADPHWRNSSCALLTAAILHCKCSRYEDKSLPGVYKFLTKVNSQEENSSNARRALLKEMMNAKHCSEEIHQLVVAYASQIYSAADQEMGSIFSSCLTAMTIFNDPLVAKAVSSSDFCLDDFRKSEKPLSWYLTIPFSDLDRLKSLIRLIIEFVCRKFSQSLLNDSTVPLKNKILFIIDEFPTLGRMETIETFAGILNGYGISFLWIAQSKSQIDKLYGKDTPLFEHCRYITIYAVGDENAAEYFSKRIGKEGIVKQNTSTQGNRYDVMMNTLTVSNDITERPLMTANELSSLSCEYEIIITQGGYPQVAKKVAYYSDKRFKDLVNLPFPDTKEALEEEMKFSLVKKGEKKDSWTNIDEEEEEDFSLAKFLAENFNNNN